MKFKTLSKSKDFKIKDLNLKDFTPNISSIDVTKKGAFGGTYFRNIYSNVNNKLHKNTWKEFKELKDINKKILLFRFL